MALCGSNTTSTECRVTRDVLPGLGFLDWLDEPSSPGWELLRGNGSQLQAEQPGLASGGSSSGGSSVDVGTLVGAIVGGACAWEGGMPYRPSAAAVHH